MEIQWRSLEEYKNGRTPKEEKSVESKHKNAVLDVLDSKTIEAPASRRDFLKLFGFSFATAAVVSSCEKPVQKAIPYLIKPEEVTPGKASYYASTFFDGTEYCSVLVKVRDGRPIKIEGNHQSPVRVPPDRVRSPLAHARPPTCETRAACEGTPAGRSWTT